MNTPADELKHLASELAKIDSASPVVQGLRVVAMELERLGEQERDQRGRVAALEHYLTRTTQDHPEPFQVV